MTDRVVLTLPDDRELFGVAHLVVGGLAARLNLTYETLEDLQVALEGLLPRATGDVSVALSLDDGELGVAVGPFPADALHRELERSEGTDGAVGLRRLLDTVADGYRVVERDGGAWIELTKRVESPEAA